MESYKGKQQEKYQTPSNEPVKEQVIQKPQTPDSVKPPLFNNENDKKAFERNVGKVCDILKYRNDIRSNFGDFGVKIIDSAFAIMKKQMEEAEAGRWVEATGEEKSKVKEFTNFMLNVVMDKPITDIIKDLGMELSVLTYNWNSVFGKRPDIDEQARTIERLVMMHYTTLDLITIVRKLVEKTDKILATAPPAYELSDHWLKTLDEEIAKRETKK